MVDPVSCFSFVLSVFAVGVTVCLAYKVGRGFGFIHAYVESSLKFLYDKLSRYCDNLEKVLDTVEVIDKKMARLERVTREIEELKNRMGVDEGDDDEYT